MRLKITRVDSTIPLPSYGTDEAAGFDLAAAHDLTIAPRTIALVRTGLVIEVPTGHFLAIFARSSTPLKRGLVVANGVGVIDLDYSGPADELMIQGLNVTDHDVAVRRGDRLAQGIVLAAPRVAWIEGQPRQQTRGALEGQGTDRYVAQFRVPAPRFSVRVQVRGSVQCSNERTGEREHSETKVNATCEARTQAPRTTEFILHATHRAHRHGRVLCVR